MIAEYSRYIDDSKGPALLISVRGIFHANIAASPWVQDLVQAQALEVAAHECARSAKATIHHAAGVDFLLVPVLDTPGVRGLVFALAGRELEELPSILMAIHESSRYFSQIVHMLPQIVLTARPDGRFDFVSQRWYKTLGLAPNPVGVDASVRRALARYSTEFETTWNRHVSWEHDFTLTVPLETPSGRRNFKLAATPWRSRAKIRKWIVSIEDVHQEYELNEELEKARVRLQVLADIDASLIDSSLSPAEAVRSVIVQAALSLGGIWSATFTLGEKNISLSTQPCVDLRSTGEPLVAPLDDSGTLVATPTAGRFADEDAQLFREIGVRLTAAIRGFAAYEKERIIARVLQTSMLPAALPTPLAARFDVEYRPAQNAALVGGDWYDAFELRDGRVAFSIGDVVGHGLSSAVVMGHIRDMMRAYCMQDLSPGEVLTQTNGAIVSGRGDLVTAFVAVFDPLTLTIEYSCAGHPPALFVHDDGKVEMTRCSGLMLGIDSDETYETSRRKMDAQALVLYTDGLIEYTSNICQGEQQLHDTLNRWASDGFTQSAAQLVDLTLNGHPARDDIAMLILRVVRPAVLDTTIISTARNATRARHAIERVLDTKVLGERTYDFILAMSEAINNAVEHGSTKRSDTVQFAVEWDHTGARGMVRSRGAWREGQSSIERGRGLYLMQALSDKLQIDLSERGTTVKIVMSALGSG